MSTFTQKYAIVQFLEDIPVNYEYASSDWPLHTTIADTFAIDWDNDNVLDKLRDLLNRTVSFSTQAESDTYFGEESKTCVTLLKLKNNLIDLHLMIVGLLEDAGAVFNDPQFTKSGFRPHVTVQKHKPLYNGDIVLFNALSIIDMFPNQDPYNRKVVCKISLDSEMRVVLLTNERSPA